MSTPDTDPSDCNNEYFFLPIPFWFTQHPSLALPLVALANTEIQIVVTFARTIANMRILNTVNGDGNAVFANDTMNHDALASMELVTEEVTVCEAERNWLATNPVSYLITQHDQRDSVPYSLTKTDVNSAEDYVPDASTHSIHVSD